MRFVNINGRLINTRCQHHPSTSPDEPEFVARGAVLAWRITENDTALPITCSDEIDWRGCAILAPDGRVTMHDDGSWPSEEAWLADMQEWAKKATKAP
jgi:hypothetical protein